MPDAIEGQPPARPPGSGPGGVETVPNARSNWAKGRRAFAPGQIQEGATIKPGRIPTARHFQPGSHRQVHEARRLEGRKAGQIPGLAVEENIKDETGGIATAGCRPGCGSGTSRASAPRRSDAGSGRKTSHGKKTVGRAHRPWPPRHHGQGGGTGCRPKSVDKPHVAGAGLMSMIACGQEQRALNVARLMMWKIPAHGGQGRVHAEEQKRSGQDG